MIVPGGRFLLPSSHAQGIFPGGVVLEEIDACIRKHFLFIGSHLSSSSPDLSLLSLNSKSLSSLLVQAILYTFTASCATFWCIQAQTLVPLLAFQILEWGLLSISSRPFPIGEGSCGSAFKDASILHTDNCNDVNAVQGCLYKEKGVVLLCYLAENLIPQMINVISVRFHFVCTVYEWKIRRR